MSSALRSQNDLVEVTDMSRELQAMMWREVGAAAKAVQRLPGVKKLNIAAIGAWHVQVDCDTGRCDPAAAQGSHWDSQYLTLALVLQATSAANCTCTSLGDIRATLHGLARCMRVASYATCIIGPFCCAAGQQRMHLENMLCLCVCSATALESQSHMGSRNCSS